MKYIIAAAFLACIPVANWLIGNVGTTCIPNGPCLIPVAPGMMAPSGVLVIGAALALRDAVQEALGRAWVLGLVIAGATMSFLLGSPALALASATAFLLSELADFAVYDRLRKRGLALAVMLSGIVGATLDSLLFSWLAFGTIGWAPGLILAKLYASVGYAAWLLYKRQKAAT